MTTGPEYLELGAGTRIMQVGSPETGGLCRQFGFTIHEALSFLRGLGVPVLKAPNGDWFNEYALELGLFMALHPIRPDFIARGDIAMFSSLDKFDQKRLKEKDRRILLEFGYAAMLNSVLSTEKLKRHLKRVGVEAIRDLRKGK